MSVYYTFKKNIIVHTSDIIIQYYQTQTPKMPCTRQYIKIYDFYLSYSKVLCRVCRNILKKLYYTIFKKSIIIYCYNEIDIKILLRYINSLRLDTVLE